MAPSKILIVEDEVMLGKELERRLTASGYHVVGRAATGEEAVRKAQESRPDLILMDIAITGTMDGVETAEIIRSGMDPAIIYLTGHTTQGVFERARATEPHAYLTKPVSPAELERAVDVALYKRSMEKRLRESKEKFQKTFQHAPVLMTLSRVDDGTYIDVNDHFCAVSGFSREEAIGKTSIELGWLAPEDRARLIEELGARGRVSETELELRAKDKRTVHCLYNGELVTTGDGQYLLSLAHDITARKKSEEALRESEERYRTLFQDSRDAVYVTSRDGIFVDVNQSFCDLFGYERKELDSLKVPQAYANPADREVLQEAIENGGSVKDFPLQMRKKNGEVFEGLITGSVRYGPGGEVMGYQGVIRDMTETRALERQLLQSQKLESVGTLAGGIAHDFNNLLQVVLGYSDMMLLNKDAAHPDYEGLHAIRQAARDGADLANRILAFSRRLEPNARPIDLNAQVKRVRKMLGRTLPKMIEVETILNDDLRSVLADPGQMEQILLNLAVNAQHAMPDGGALTIRTENAFLDEDYCSAHPEAAPGDYVLMTVSDTGHGMTPEVVDHIFEPFYTTKGPGEGTGLGLSMVYGIVKTHRGHIACYSEPGGGTTFKIYLPAVVQEIESDVAASQHFIAFGTETILLVDDEQQIRKLGERLLTKAGYSVLTASNGREALEVYRSNRDRIALVVLDLVMPVMGGRRCLEEILRINPSAKVIIASGYSLRGSAKDDVEILANGFVRKPYEAKEILGVIRQVLDEQQGGDLAGVHSTS